MSKLHYTTDVILLLQMKSCQLKKNNKNSRNSIHNLNSTNNLYLGMWIRGFCLDSHSAYVSRFPSPSIYFWTHSVRHGWNVLIWSFLQDHQKNMIMLWSLSYVFFYLCKIQSFFFLGVFLIVHVSWLVGNVNLAPDCYTMDLRKRFKMFTMMWVTFLELACDALII